jgi:hypothetical protein
MIKLVRPMSLPEKPEPRRFPLNAPGPFYVEDGLCIACTAPEAEAPDLMSHAESCGRPGSYHCYFRRQPKTPEELSRAIYAVCVSCCGAVRYAGDDPKVLGMLRALLSEDKCDAWSDDLDIPEVPPPMRSVPPASLRTWSITTHPMWDRELDG